MALTVAWTVAGMAASLAPAVFGGDPWWYVPGDIWLPVRAAHYVAEGAWPYLYEEVPLYRGLPLLPILFAPLSEAGLALGLSESLPTYLRRPTMWLLLGPVVGALSVVPLAAARAFAVRIPGAAHRATALQVAVLVLGVGSTIAPFGHPEDLLAIGLLVAAVVALADARTIPAALALGAAIGFKHWAALALPVFAVAVPPRERLRAAVVAAVLPAALAAGPLLADPEHAVDTLLVSEAFTTLGRPAPWAGGETFAATPLRALAVTAALTLAVVFRNRLDAGRLVAALTVLFAVRVVSEPALFVYYATPAVVFAMLHAIDGRTAFARALVSGTALLAWFWAPLQPDLAWWLGATGLTAVVAAPAGRDIVAALRRPRP